MFTRRLLLSATLGIAALGAQTGPAYDLPPVQTIMVPMRDGVRLATDVYLPARNGAPSEGKFPAVVEGRKEKTPILTKMPEKTGKTCFVVMGFGKKTDFETGRTLDLDKSYRNIIKPAVEAAGLRCIRADEIVHSGLIDVPMYEQLLNANVVVADLSTSNKNAFYELGVRHALRPYTTVVIAEDGIKTFPFDLNHVAVRRYHHLGEDIGYDEQQQQRPPSATVS